MIKSAASRRRPAPLTRIIGKFVAPAEERTKLLRYGLAFTLPLMDFVLTWQVFNLRRAPYFSLFTASLVITALVGGKGPGIVHTIVATILGFMVAPPAWTTRLSEPEDAMRIALFAVVGLVISVLVGAVGELHGEAEVERHRLRETLSNTPAGIGVMRGPEHRWEYVNEEFLRVTGRTRLEDYLGKSIRESMPEIEAQPFIGLLDDVYRTGIPYVGCEMKATLKRMSDGKLEDIYFDFVYQPLRDAEARVDGILVHAIDVTDKVRIKQKMQQSEAARRYLATIVECSDDSIISKDLKGVVTYWNPAAEKLFGYSAEEMVGQSITTIIPPELQGDEGTILATIARGERIHHFETIRVTRSGERLEVSLTIFPVRNENGMITGAAKILRDITQQKKAERALRQSEKLASVARLASTVAHEINNPLEAVTNLVYLAKESTRETAIRDYLQVADDELQRIAFIARQTLGFFRDSNGPRSVKVGELLPVAISVASKTRNKGIEIRSEIRDEIEIHAVPGEIRQLMANLLSNSIDAVDAGGRIRVRIEAGRDWSEEEKPGVKLLVADSGRGIPGEVRRKLFEPFVSTKEDVGTGLGLWICKSIVDKHGGSIRFKSSSIPGRSWTVFSVFLPLAKAEKGRAQVVSIR